MPPGVSLMGSLTHDVSISHIMLDFMFLLSFQFLVACRRFFLFVLIPPCFTFFVRSSFSKYPAVLCIVRLSCFYFVWTPIQSRQSVSPYEDIHG